MKNTLIASTLIATLASGSAIAIENQFTVCKKGDVERKIEVIYLEDKQVPCEVQYTKNSGTEILWWAESQVGYCEEKADTFISKQESWGWECESLDMEAPVAMDDSAAAGSLEEALLEEPLQATTAYIPETAEENANMQAEDSAMETHENEEDMAKANEDAIADADVSTGAQ